MNFYFQIKQCAKIVIFITFFSQISYGNQTVNVNIQINGTLNKELTLAYNYGNKIFLQDTIKRYGAKFNMHNGVYYLMHKHDILVEFYIPPINNQQITFNIDTNFKTNISNAHELTMLYAYITQKSEKTNLLAYQQQAIKYNDTLFLDFIKLLTPVELDSNTDKSSFNNERDYLMYLQKINTIHYLNNVNFNNVGLIYLPGFTEKIDFFLDKICPQNHDKLAYYADFILQKAKNKPVMLRFLANYLIDKYGNKLHFAKYEFVYLTLVNKYVMQSNAMDITNEKKYELTTDYKRRIYGALGKQFANIDLKNAYNGQQSLYQLISDYKLLFYYDFDCQLCHNLEKQLLQFANNPTYRHVKVVAVCLNHSKRNWRKHIKNNKLENWVNLIDIDNNTALKAKVHLNHIPTLILLNNHNEIVMKNMNIKQLERYINMGSLY